MARVVAFTSGPPCFSSPWCSFRPIQPNSWVIRFSSSCQSSIGRTWPNGMKRSGYRRHASRVRSFDSREGIQVASTTPLSIPAAS